MRRAPIRVTRALLLAACSVVAPAAHATNAVVPDAYPTIQQAIDSGVDTVWVKPGTYHESVTLRGNLALRGVVPYQAPGQFLFYELPVIDEVLAGAMASDKTLTDLRILSAPERIEGNFLTILGCRFDSGLQFGHSTRHYIQNCFIYGDLDGTSLCEGDCGRNTVIGGSVILNGNCGTVLVHDNAVLGPASVGIVGNTDITIHRNYVRGCVTGIRKSGTLPGDVEDNVVEDCSGNGYEFLTLTQGPEFKGNMARRCGGRGFDISRTQVFSGNTAEDCALEGIVVQQAAGSSDMAFANNTVLRSGSTGIRVTDYVFRAIDNRVIGAQGDGISLAQVLRVSGNIVGHCAARGIVATDFGALAMRNNTAYANGGAGFDVHSSWAGAADSLTNNIAAHNALGLAWSGPAAAPALIGCNDWFANTNGDVTGTPVGATDVALNPLFCDEANDIVSLASTSPLVSLAGCGLVGAQGVGCSVAASVPGLQAPRLGRLRIAPQPSSGVTRFTWNPAAAPVELAIYDVTGARRWSRTIAAGAGETVWTGRGDDGTALPAGVYFARLAQGAERSEATVVVVR